MKAGRIAFRLFTSLYLVCCGVAIHAQDIPPGVRYKHVSDAVNTRAKVAMEGALSNAEFPQEFVPQAFTCGPMLWKALKPSADQVLLESKSVTGFIETPQPSQVELKAPLTDPERRMFWKALLDKFPALKSAKIRTASASEIKYYWATIPFDIEEPFFALDAGPDTFITELVLEKDKPILFWIDLVGDLKTLKK
jgi:hypothetical protein